jgi:hypothetical protein
MGCGLMRGQDGGLGFAMPGGIIAFTQTLCAGGIGWSGR